MTGSQATGQLMPSSLSCRKSEARDAACSLPWLVAECLVHVSFMGHVGWTWVFPKPHILCP